MKRKRRKFYLGYPFLIDRVELIENVELLDIRRIPQDGDPWYPAAEKKYNSMGQYYPDLIRD